jgi:hypothetical protein
VPTAGVSGQSRVQPAFAAERANSAILTRRPPPYTEKMRPAVEYMMNKRIVILVEQVRTRSWTIANSVMRPDPNAIHPTP